MELKHINYRELNGRQKERYNFQKIAGLLADYGYSSIKLDDDWQGADFIAQHINGSTFLKVQLKGRLTFDKKYIEKEIAITFPYKNQWYLFAHDELLKMFSEEFPSMLESSSWEHEGCYSWGTLSPQILKLLEPYRLKPAANILVEVDEVHKTKP